MPNPNQSSTSPEQETFAHQEIVQYSDGNTALAFRTPGDKLVLGPTSGHKYARNFELTNMAIIKTESGNLYFFGHGLVVNNDRGLAFELPDQPIDVTIGEACEIPDVSHTTAVEYVLLRYKGGDYSDRADLIKDAPSPFEVAEEHILKIKNSLK